MQEKSIFTGSKAYLEKSFLEELSYKVWSTKGARFKADERLMKTAKMSNISLSVFSAYLIIASLISVYVGNYKLNFQIINYFVTSLSIILLVLSQYESSQDYKMRAVKFHECALELSKIYNEIRIFKTLSKHPTDEECRTFCEDTSRKYQDILAKYENHSAIDYDTFRLLNPDYFSEYKAKTKSIKFRRWWAIYGWYTLLLIGTPMVFIGFSFVKF
ncbi:SLATT domain-containing protein [Pseudopedobacter beijingensis]|uniref:SLATT domain-containing protein n=1 Tax=Pseudopedobacter beijingensis TaxID=1207056 RepID=A0ABW4I9G9_9SPHI